MAFEEEDKNYVSTGTSQYIEYPKTVEIQLGEVAHGSILFMWANYDNIRWKQHTYMAFEEEEKNCISAGTCYNSEENVPVAEHEQNSAWQLALR